MQKPEKKILIPTDKGAVIETVENILFVKSNIRNCLIIRIEGNDIVYNKSLKNFEEYFSYDCFLRIHKSYLVNINHIVEIVFDKEAYVKLSNNCILKIAERKRSDVRKFFNFNNN